MIPKITWPIIKLCMDMSEHGVYTQNVWRLNTVYHYTPDITMKYSKRGYTLFSDIPRYLNHSGYPGPYFLDKAIWTSNFAWSLDSKPLGNPVSWHSDRIPWNFDTFRYQWMWGVLKVGNLQNHRIQYENFEWCRRSHIILGNLCVDCSMQSGLPRWYHFLKWPNPDSQWFVHHFYLCPWRSK